VNKEVCCGMPKFELGDLESLEKSKNENIPVLAKMVDAGWDLTAPVPSCVLMFKQELPLMFPDDPDVIKVRDAFYDPFEYLIQRHKENKLNTEFKTVLGDVSYQVPCHLRVQNIGLKTKEILELIPDTKVEAIERCSGHDGTYAVKEEFHEISMKIAKPVINRVTKSSAQHFTSDCPMAAEQIMNGVNKSDPNSQPHSMHPISLLCKAYGI
jgi:Fe-S oxidoreductase